MSKYNNKHVVIDGIDFDSQTEGDYYVFLKSKVEAGEIDNLRMQVPYELIPPVYGEKTVVKHLKRGDKIITKQCVIQRPTYYLADFVYTDAKTGKEEVVDVKSPATRKKESYRLKKKMMLAFKGIEVIEVMREYKPKKKKNRN